jgi:hypothetical protein
MPLILYHRELTAEEQVALEKLYCRSFYRLDWSTREWIRQCFRYSYRLSIIRPYGYGNMAPTREDIKKTNGLIVRNHREANSGNSYGYSGFPEN